MSDSYFTASIPQRYRILGVTLKPFSLGRYRLLKRFESAFVADEDAQADMGDLLLGIAICSTRCDEFLEWADSPNFTKDIRKWSKTISPWPSIGRLPFIGRFWRKRFSFDALAKIRLFAQYIFEHSKAPLYWDETQGSGSPSGAHWAQTMEVILRGELGWSEEEINERPLSKAMADYFKWAETKGQIRLMTEWEIEEIRRIGEENARIMEGLSGS